MGAQKDLESAVGRRPQAVVFDWTPSCRDVAGSKAGSGHTRKYLYTFVTKSLAVAETKVYLPDGLDAQLRERAMKRFGYGRGSISRAVEAAVVQWLALEDAIGKALDALVEKARADPKALAVILFGSYARKDPSFGDVDVALLFDGTGRGDLLSYEGAAMSGGALRPPRLDIVAFGELPLDLQRRALEEGVTLYARDERELRGVAARVAQLWDDFAPTLASLAGGE